MDWEEVSKEPSSLPQAAYLLPKQLIGFNARREVKPKK
jgi:hypothetical protein